MDLHKNIIKIVETTKISHSNLERVLSSKMKRDVNYTKYSIACTKKNCGFRINLYRRTIIQVDQLKLHLHVDIWTIIDFT